MKTTVQRFMVGVVLMAAVGCSAEMGDDRHVDSLYGTLGEVTVAGIPDLHEVQLRDRVLFLDVRLVDAYGNTAMIVLKIPRDHALEEELGSVTAALRPEDAEMVGCSGDNPDDWDFDCTPDEFTVGIVDKGDRAEVEFEGDFSDCDDSYLDLEDPPTVYGDVEVDDLI